MTTTPADPGTMARVDQVHADASRFIDDMLTHGVSELELADELKCDNDVGRWPALPAALIKLVDDHG